MKKYISDEENIRDTNYNGSFIRNTNFNSQKRTTLFLTSSIIFILLLGISFLYTPHFITPQTDVSNGLQKVVFLAWWAILFSILQIFLSIPIIVNTNKTFIQKIIQHGYLIITGLTSSLCILDFKLYAVMGNHVYDSFILQSVTNSGINKEIHFGISTFVSLGLFIVIAFTTPYLLNTFINKIDVKFSAKKAALCLSIIPLSSIAIIAFNLPVLSSMNSSLPFIEKTGLFTDQCIKTDLDIEHMPQHATLKQYTNYAPYHSDSISKPNILYIVIESLRSDVMTKELTPTLLSLYDTLSTIKSRAHFSSSHVTETGIFSLLYGIHSYNYKTFADNKIPSIAIRMLKANNYIIQGVSASRLSNWHGSGFMINQFDTYKEFTNGPPNNDDQLIVDYLKTNHIHRQNNNPICQFVFLNSTHHNYYYPASFEFYKPVMPFDYNHFLGDDKLEKDKFKIINRYKNSVKYIDFIVNQIINIYHNDIVQHNLIIVITGDHAEEFWDKGFLGHGAPNLYNCRTRVPLIFYLPHAVKKEFDFTSHSEIMPSIIDYIDTKQYQLMKPFFNGTSLLEPIDYNTHDIIISASSFEKNHILCLINTSGKYWLKADKKDPFIKITKHLDMNDNETKKYKINSQTAKQILNEYSGPQK